VGNVGSKYAYWLLEGYKCSTAGDFPSNPILSGSAPNKTHNINEAIIIGMNVKNIA
jgi:hypothetical protein